MDRGSALAGVEGEGGDVVVAAAIPNFLILEFALNQPHRDLSQSVGIKVEKGWAELPTGPGLGIELNKAEIAKHPYGARDYSAAYYADGSVAVI